MYLELIIRLFSAILEECFEIICGFPKVSKELWVNPDCGLKTRGVLETEASLRNMVKAAEQIRSKV